jgi:hypothetical protein
MAPSRGTSGVKMAEMRADGGGSLRRQPAVYYDHVSWNGLGLFKEACQGSGQPPQHHDQPR